jgi:quinol-cytochrome oxidoreductase complex cytochrome b subunit
MLPSLREIFVNPTHVARLFTVGDARRSRVGVNSGLINVIKNHLVYYPTPNNFYYIFGVGSLLGIMLVIQVVTGVLLAMHYVPNIDLAFESVERIMREVPTG